MKKDEEWKIIQQIYTDVRKAVMSENFEDVTEIRFLFFISMMEFFEPDKKQVGILETALKHFPKSELTKLQLARRYVTENHLEKAEKLLLELEFTSSVSAGFLIARGAYLIKIGKLAEGIANLEEAIDLAEPEATRINALSQLDFGNIESEDYRAKYVYEAGRALLEGAYPREAIKYFEQAIKIPSGKQIFAPVRLAECYLRLGNEEKAIEILDTQLQKSPFFLTPWVGLGDIYRKRGEYDKAIDAYEYAIAIDENYYPAWFGRGKSYFQKGEYLKAVENLTDIVDMVVEKTELLVHLCESYSGAEDYDNLHKYGMKLAEVLPGSYLGWGVVAVSFLNREKWDEAVPYIEKVLEITPDNEEYLYYYGIASKLSGQNEKTVKAFERLLEINSDYPDNYGIYISLGNAYQELDDDSNAVKNYLKAYDKGYAEEKFTFKIALLYYRLNDIESVKKYLDLAINDYSVDAPIFFIEHYPESRFALADYIRSRHSPEFDPDQWEK